MRILTEKMDDLHMSREDFRAIDGYGKPFNVFISAREWGKSTGSWIWKIFSAWLANGRPWIYLTRSCVEITDALIDTIFETNINKWLDEPVKPEYKASDFASGIVDVSIQGKPFLRIVALSIKLRRIKLATLRNCGGVFMDEYVIDPRSGEKYLPGEAFKIKEAYTTWRRESEGMLRVYICGNPYSLYNPLFLDWGVDSSALVKSKGSYYVGDGFVIRWAELPERLKEHILAVNPLYEFDKDYSDYALEGNAVNDRNIPLKKKQPDNFSLRFVLRVNGRFIGVYRGNDYENGSFPFWCCFIDSYSAKRVAWCFDLSELVNRSALIGAEERIRLSSFREAVRLRNVEYSDVAVYYLIEEIYKTL